MRIWYSLPIFWHEHLDEHWSLTAFVGSLMDMGILALAQLAMDHIVVHFAGLGTITLLKMKNNSIMPSISIYYNTLPLLQKKEQEWTRYNGT